MAGADPVLAALRDGDDRRHGMFRAPPALDVAHRRALPSSAADATDRRRQARDGAGGPGT
jgi:hypothetical protein